MNLETPPPAQDILRDDPDADEGEPRIDPTTGHQTSILEPHRPGPEPRTRQEMV